VSTPSDTSKGESTLELALAGRVVVEGAGNPVPGVAVEAFDVTKAQKHPARLTDADISWVAAEPSLGSAITDEDGNFGWTVERDAFPIRLAVAVFGAGPRKDPELLKLVERVRTVVAGTHELAIHVPADALRRSAAGEPGSAPARVAAAREQAVGAETLREGAEQARTGRVDAVRKTRSATEASVIKAFVDRQNAPAVDSKGVLAPSVVPLGTSVRAHMRGLMDDVLRSSAQAFTARGLIDLSDEARAALLDAAGNPKPNVIDDDIRDALFGPGFEEGSPHRHRRDLVSVACRLRSPPYERCGDGEDDGGGDGDSGGDDGDGGDGDTGSAQLRRIKALTAQLLEDATRLTLTLGSGSQRSTTRSLSEELRELLIGGGPADDVALFDFERLFLAADLAVRPETDPGLTHDMLEAIEQAATLGGDVGMHASSGKDVLAGLVEEAKTLAASDPYRSVQRSHLSQQPGAIARMGGIADAAAWVDDLWANALGDTAGGAHGRFDDLLDYLDDLSAQRRSNYPFSPFATDGDGPAVTYGLVLGYRQRWEPRGYQAGELVRSIPLAPKSTIKYSTRRKRVRSYSEKRTQASESAYSSEEQDVTRDVAKIVKETKLNTSLSLTHEAGGGVPGVGSGSTSTVWNVGAARDSSSTKELFREETRKQTEAHKQSSSLELTVATTDELEVEETSEVSNPNDELVVTYLFYELQRRFLVSEHLHRVTPVVLVAQPLPAPSSLDSVWLARHDWIVRRVLLDRSLAPALEYAVSGKILADKGRAEELEAALEQQRAVVEAVKRDLVDLSSENLLPDPENVWQLWRVHEYDEKYGYAWRDDEDKVRDVFGDEVADRLAQRKRTIETREADLKRELGNLERATSAYVEAFSRYAREAIQLERLLLHVKDNVIYYMQAIWEHESRDQRYLRLRHVSVPEVTGTVTYRLEPPDRPPRAPTFHPPVGVTATSRLRVTGDVELGDVADLAAPLGFVGNAMVLPVMRWSRLVEFLMVPFACALTGVNNPDDTGNMTLSEVEALVCCLKENLPARDFNALKPLIDAAWEARIDDPRPDAEELMVPTGSLFIEALPGGHPVLEDFKLFHRALDVQQVMADLVGKQLEQLRLGARIIGDELDDPNVDRKINVLGNVGVVPTPDGG
jgi:hypothetical protein